MEYVLLFPGQGSQKPGMGSDLAAAYPAARAAFATVDDSLGVPLSQLCFAGPAEELTLTHNAQPALFAHGAAVWAVLADRLGSSVRAAAGHSLGEFTAYHAAGALTIAEGARLVRERGRLMYETGTTRQGAMAAILGDIDDTIAAVCAKATAEAGIVVVANWNCPGQLVISGEVAAVERAMTLAKEAGAKRAIRLNVSGAFHSPLMEPAELGLRRALETTTFGDPSFPVYSNVTTGPVASTTEARETLVRQVVNPVRWTDEIRALAQAFPNATFLELGPGTVLAGLVKKIVPGREVISCGTAADVTRVLEVRRMNIDLTGKVAVVTGGTRGIGRAIAESLSTSGAIVIVVGRDATTATEVASALPGAHGKACDMGNVDAVETLVKDVEQSFGQIDILVNNAGITKDNIIFRLGVDDWDAVLDTNLRGPFVAMRAVARGMMKRRWGRIVNISSVVGLVGNPGQTNYAASKAGLLGLTKSFAKELASRNVLANVVAPGFIETDMTAAMTPDAKTTLQGQIPLGRLGQPADIASLVTFLASEHAAYITGQVFVVDGGMVM